MHYKLKHGGTGYHSYVGAGYCTRCGMWGIKEILVTQIGNRQLVSYKHIETIHGKRLTVKRCFCEAVP